MCYVCEGSKDIRTLVHSVAILTDINFDRAKTVVAGAVDRLDVIEKTLLEQGVDTLEIDLDDYFSPDEPLEQSLKATMQILSLTEAYIDEARALLGEASIIYPTDTESESESLDVFEHFVENMFSRDADEHGEEDEDAE